MAVSNKAWDPAQFEGLYRCVHCGLCLGACPTYRELGVETDSPRGRLYLMRAMVEGRLEPNAGVVEHMERCLVCRACETACPSGVEFGHLMELTRDEIKRQQPKAGIAGVIRQIMFREVFPFPQRLRALAGLGRFYQQSGIQMLARRLGLIPSKLGETEKLMPVVSEQPFVSPPGEWFRATGPTKHRVGLLSGCIMSVAFAEVDRATVRVLTRNGCDVFVPNNQTCCGALHAHDGDREGAEMLARQNIDAFLSEDLDAVIVNAAGCGAAMKSYRTLLDGDDRAAQFTSKVRDVSEFLASVEVDTNFGRLERTITYQDACHLAHGQRVREQPRALLRAIPGVQLVEMKDADRCCGSAGIYNIVQPELSRRIGQEKCSNVVATGADMVVSGNPGCMIQLESGLRAGNDATPVRHIVEILDEAYRAAEGG